MIFLNISKEDDKIQSPLSIPKFTKNKYCCFNMKMPTLTEINTKILNLKEKVDEQYESMQSDGSKEGKFCGKAFIVFNKQSDASNILDLFSISALLRMIKFILFKICRINKCHSSKFSLKNKRIKMERAAEPTDVYWENISIKTAQRFKYILLTYC